MQNTSNFFFNKTIAVTGANGYLASAIIPMLLGERAKVICVSRSPFSRFDKVEYIVEDTQNPKLWMKIAERAEVIIHLGGNTSIYDAKRDPLSSLQSTVFPIIHLVNAAKILKDLDVDVHSHISPNTPHSIAQDGLEIAIKFLSSNFSQNK